MRTANDLNLRTSQVTNPLCNRFADPFYGYDVKVIITPKKQKKPKAKNESRLSDKSRSKTR